MPTLETMYIGWTKQVGNRIHLFFSAITSLWLICCSPFIPVRAQNALPAIIPAPQSYVTGKGVFDLRQPVTLVVHTGIKDSLGQLIAATLRETGINISLASQAVPGNSIVLRVDKKKVTQAEGYLLTVSPKQVMITGHDEAGIFYGWQTLLQLFQEKAGSLIIAACTIRDHPRFSYRGMHLDVSRHMFSTATIKKWLDVLAFYKINRFHWHLTDDQGWRIEIKKYPLLQSVAAYRDETIIGHKKEWPHRFDGIRYGGYYTQDEVRDIVAYAAKKYITVIPEIEMPGHASAALAAYPELGCTGGPYQAATFWGIFDDVFCAGNDKTFTFLQDVLDEVISLFPSRYIHIGGDECPKTRWKACAKCQRRKKEQQLDTEEQLQSYFIRRVEKHVASRNRQIIGWDEILEGGLAPDAVVMSWRGEEGGIAAARQQHDVVMTPDKFFYLDYYQSLYANEPVAAGGYLPLKKMYQYEPLPAALTPAEQKYIKGVQANVWSEYLPNVPQAEYMLFPRILALAETGWTTSSKKSYPAFLQRLQKHKKYLQGRDIDWPEHYYEITDTITAMRNGQVKIKLHTASPGWKIYYTTDGRTPTPEDKPYNGPVTISKKSVINAALYDARGEQQMRVYSQSISISKATGKKVRFTHAPSGNYKPADNSSIVNGIDASHRYNDGYWTGFSGVDMEAVIDLEKEQEISHIRLNILRYHWQRMWAPDWIKVAVSEDGKVYQEIGRYDKFPVNGINPVALSVAKGTKGRYIKITAKNKGTIPAGEYGAGGKAWLLVNNIQVY